VVPEAFSRRYPPALNAVLNMLARHVPDREIRVTGSRVSGQATSFSDLDLVVMADQPLDLRTLGQLRDASDEAGSRQETTAPTSGRGCRC
jgi:predicted nucleotidyltransferase